ncbi:hypothetical protein ACQQ2N_14700 [Dokdonella sp. MW10]|uniref:hypothetical protein n=1 Tax=Dokdonella sp. MW10 TaxID=2992926 RepID=UPI003F7D1537
MNRWLAIALAAALAGWWFSPPFARSRPPGILAPDAPRQVDLADAASFLHGDYTVQPLAEFRVHARVLSREDYRFDAGAPLSPMDLALGWGAMSDSALLEKLDFHQSVRYMYLRWSEQKPLPLPWVEISRQFGNMHMVPATPSVATWLGRVRAGDVVHIEGLLIEASLPSGWRWRSSLTRDDTGNGACELVYVTSISRS